MNPGTRLRARLGKYYAGEGSNDPLFFGRLLVENFHILMSGTIWGHLAILA